MTFIFLCYFTGALIIGALISGVSHRTALSTAVFFLFAGSLCTNLGLLQVSAEDPLISQSSKAALILILFTDGMKISPRQIREVHRLAGRVLLIGMPLTILLTSLAARLLTSVSWTVAFLIGASLSPTDPVFASALVGAEQVPVRVRHLLNFESGVNDGIALPLVLGLLGIMGAQNVATGSLIRSLVLGVLIGALAPMVILKLRDWTGASVTSAYRPVLGVAILLSVILLVHYFDANEFLASFTSGVVVGALRKKQRQPYENFGEALGELGKITAIFIFGSLITWHFLMSLFPTGLLFAAASIFVARPLAIILSLADSPLSSLERFTTAWFGPKGFASVVFGLLVLHSGIQGRQVIFQMIAASIILSIVLHSSSDVPIVKIYARGKTPSALHT